MEHTQLDIDMSYLEINEMNSVAATGKRQYDSINSLCTDQEEATQEPRRSTRKKIRSLNSTDNRRVLTKPKKVVCNTIKETINYYLDKRVKRLPSTLETIFEEPKRDDLMSKRKFKRSIEFPNLWELPKMKTRKPSMKTKKVNIMRKLKGKITLELLKEKLSEVELDLQSKDTSVQVPE